MITSRFAAVATAAVLTAGAAAAEFPERPIDMIVPVGAGGGTDMHARALAAALSDDLGAPVNAVNRPGAGGYVGAQSVAQARPDGYTIMVQSYGTFMMRAIAGPQPVDPLEDFRILGLVGELYTGLVVRSDDERFATMDDFLAYAQATPTFTYGFSGSGSWHNAAAAAMGAGVGVEGRPVTFRGGGAVRAALLGGQVDVAWMGVQQIAGFEEQLTMLAVNADERYALAADIPTLGDLGLDYTLVTSPMIVAAPAGIDEETAARLETAVAAAALSDAYGTTLRENLAVPRYLPAAEARAYLAELRQAWGPVADLIR